MRPSGCGVAIALILVFTGWAEAQTWRPPADSQRCPLWGAGDERGRAIDVFRRRVVRRTRCPSLISGYTTSGAPATSVARATT